MKPVFIMFVGLNGSYKNRYVSDSNMKIFSFEQISMDLFNQPDGPKHLVMDKLYDSIHKMLASGKSCGYNGLNLNAKKRAKLLNLLKDVDCNKYCYVFNDPLYCCVQRYKKENHVVDGSEIINEVKEFNLPSKQEGWDHISILGSPEAIDYRQNLGSIFCCPAIPHDCEPHHLESIQQHMLMSAIAYKNSCFGKSFDKNIYEALIFHDIGKPLAKVFVDSRGKKVDQAHYYGHENISAYLYISSKNFYEHGLKLEIPMLIQLHMKPYILSKEQMLEKYPEEIVKKLLIIQKFDKEGRITPSLFL